MTDADRKDYGLSNDDHVYMVPQSAFKLHPSFDSVFFNLLRADPKASDIFVQPRVGHSMTLSG